MTVKERDGDGEETGEARTLFRAVAVFDVSQTDPLPNVEPVPLKPPRELITGSSHAHLITRSRTSPPSSATRPPPPLNGQADGWCDFERQDVVVAEKLAPKRPGARARPRARHTLGLGYRDFGRERAEVLVDTVPYVVRKGTGSAALRGLWLAQTAAPSGTPSPAIMPRVAALASGKASMR